MTLVLFSTVTAWLLIAVGTWLGYQLIQQNGRILLRLEAIEKRMQAPRPARQQGGQGLRVGSAAPDFELSDLAGKPRTLSEFRGRDVLLIFFNPKCGFCAEMAADLTALSPDGKDGHVFPIVVTTGDPEENRELFDRLGLRFVVLLQQQMEVASQYHAQGTPMGYRIDAEGKIASELAIGAEALLRLAAREEIRASESESGSPSHGKQPDPSLARSRLNRDGLKAGATAPEFRLPRIDEGELSLADLRGERVLLVFSDPECGPCDALAPRLQQVHLQRSDLQVVVISRRDLEANRLKAKSLGLTFPILLQKQWEISLKYAMFATPIGYLIDEHGILLRDVAVGVEPILALTKVSAAEPASPEMVSDSKVMERRATSV